MSEYKELEVIVLAGITEVTFIGIAFLCGLWIIIVRILRNYGHNTPLQYTHIPQKIAFFCSIAFAVSFGICSAWLYLPKL